MSMPSDIDEEPRFAGERLLTQFTPQQRGWAAAALVTFIGVAYLGPALTRLTRPKSRTQRFRDEMAKRTRAARAHARRVGTKAQKKARRLGGGTIWR